MSTPAAFDAQRLARVAELLGAARRAWVRVDTLDVEWHTARRAVDALTGAAVTGLQGPAGVGIAELQGAQARLGELDARRRSARNVALRATQSAALEGWGVRIGGRYRILELGASRSHELVLDYMRPGTTLPADPTLVVTGRDASGQEQVVVLNRRDTLVEDVAPGVVALSAWRRHQSPAPRMPAGA